jgi:hypothetical protein
MSDFEQTLRRPVNGSRHILTAQESAQVLRALDKTVAPTWRAKHASKIYKERVLHAD